VLRLIVICTLLLLLLGLPANADPVTFYDSSYCGNLTTSGEHLDCSALTAAHPYLPFGSSVTVCWDGCTTVRITDRGPNLDLTPAAASAIGLDVEGVINVPVTVH
jgi:rare lipoprotein A